MGKVFDEAEVSFVETPLANAKPLPTPPQPIIQQPEGLTAETRTAEDEALIDDTLARLRTLPEMPAEQVDSIARELRHPTAPLPRMMLRQINALAKLEQEKAQKKAAEAAATAKATPAPEATKQAIAETPASSAETAQANTAQAKTDTSPAASAGPASAVAEPTPLPASSNSRRWIDRIRRARETSEPAPGAGIFNGKVGAHLPPTLPPEMLAMAHTAHKPAELSGSPSDASPPEPIPWHKHLAETIAALERELSQPAHASDEALRLAARLRLLQLVAERKDEALREIDELEPHERDYWRSQMHSLSITLASDGTPVKGRRAALALRPLREAVDHLAAGATLDVKNVALCKSVTIWGNYTEFDEYTFKPNQEVLLYFEVENFVSQQTSKGFATEFVSSYEIFDVTGRRVAEQQFPIAQETCQNRRRDYFIRYHLHVPKTLLPGDYTLQLTVEDQNGHKFGQGSVKFKVSG